MSNQSNNRVDTSTDNLAPVTSVGEWVVTLLILCIPIVNLIMLIIWACNNGNGIPNRATFSKAYLIMMAIGVVCYILLFVLFGSLMAGAGAGASTY
ncbi:hypothetical protein BGI03_03780 [Snodgrassella alvi]|uniref:hypothetical protein n=1 Tax=Snodgrassella alvi TaxID=1196083 RepID=UPI0009FC6E28|nr:hypothetical protein [Snodgrassella alvi]ORF08211.1 hypothetical protein BGH98_02810 [Snodgrassella alvi]ORF16002.1 hypothetical protein BGI01_01380 [Snodgrassella alvi]ORF19652.1 hypothetical protein BGI03_03780 [Snodgrassella alvi]ORF21786.1 hypothetical protein BGI04_02100 [Snodgrassella alvi]